MPDLTRRDHAAAPPPGMTEPTPRARPTLSTPRPPPRRWPWVALGALLLALAATAAAWLGGAPQQAPSASASAPVAFAHALRPDDAALVARGATIYAQQCAACHGAKGEGQPDWRERGPTGMLPAPPHDASGHTWHHPDEQLFAITRNGMAATIGQPNYQSTMPAYAGVLSDADIVAVLSYIKAQWPVEVRQRHDQVNVQAREMGR